MPVSSTMGKAREQYRQKRERDGKRRLSAQRLGREILELPKPPVDTEKASERWEDLKMEIPDADTNPKGA